MIRVAPALSQVDVVLILSQLWEVAESCLFIDSSEEDYLACSITCFKGAERATVGMVYTASGGAARVFNGQMQVIAQTPERLKQENYNGLKNMMLEMQKSLPSPIGITEQDLLEEG